jgi:thiosulfate/3-mercaptopyruvate sulfurtransferase
MSGPLITPDELAAAMGEPDLIVLDIRSVVDGGGRAAYEAGHIPGAVHTDYVAGGWRVKSASGGAGMLPDEAALGRLLGDLGITPASRVVVAPAGTSAGDLAAASRVYWTLKVAGHDSVSLLDGGTAAWVASGRALETTIPASRPAPAYPVRLRANLRATLPEMERALAEKSVHLVDTRNGRSFLGEEKSPAAARAGRIPGALHQDNVAAFDATTGRLKREAELRSLFALPEGEVVTYCNTGQQAATNWLVLSEILGRPGVRLYDGSLSEWTADPARPVETGPER